MPKKSNSRGNRLVSRIIDDLALLLGSRRLRVGNAIGNLVQMVTRRRSQRADQRLRQSLDELRAANSDDVAPILRKIRRQLLALEKSRRWKAGQVVGSIATMGRKRSGSAFERLNRRISRALRGRKREKAYPKNSEEYTWGISRAEDEGQLQRHYSKFVRSVEPMILGELRAKNGASGVHLIFDARSDSGRSANLSLIRSLALRDNPHFQITVVTLRHIPMALSNRIRVVETDTTDPSGLRAAIEGGVPDYFMILRPGDVASSDIPHAIAAAPGADAIVVDHDHLSWEGVRYAPAFKPGLSPTFLLGFDYVGRGVLLSKEAALSHLADLDVDMFVRDLILRIDEKGGRVAKVDAMLLHCRPLSRDGTSEAASGCFAERVLARRGVSGHITAADDRNHVRYSVPGEPQVSVIIPVGDKGELLETCVRSILQMSSWQNLEVLLVDYESGEPATHPVVARLVEDRRVHVMNWNRPFSYSAVNNAAVRATSGDLLIFLIRDILALTDRWIEELVGYAVQPRIGAVGAKLVSPDGRLQHAGVVVGLDGFARNLLTGVHEVTLSPELTHVARECLAVTGACLAIERSKFESIGGFNEAFEPTGSDVELCLRLHLAGYRNVWNPGVQLVHVEKATRGVDSTRPRDVYHSERNYEPLLSAGDPFYNAQLSARGPRRLPLTKQEAIARTLDRMAASAPGHRDRVVHGVDQ